MNQLSSFIPSTIALGSVMVAAVVLTMIRPRLRPEARKSARFVAVTGLTILAQGLHFIEELRSNFHVLFPEAFSLQPFSEGVFVSFNVAWLVIWVLSLFAVRAGIVIAVCPLWFLGLAMVLNLVAHPILALRAGGYFPGLFSAPLVGLFGALLIRELFRATASDNP